MTKTTTFVLSVLVLLSVPAAALDSLADADAVLHSAAQNSRVALDRESYVAAIARVASIYKRESGQAAWPTRCLGERNFVTHHRGVAELAIAGLDIKLGKHAGPAGLKALQEELAPTAAQLLEFGKSRCMQFDSERTRGVWNDALERLSRPY